MSRIRQVWPREQVAHLWANASQDSARDPSGNMYFSGPALYSYGEHFAIGYRYDTADGAFYIMNADSYSATTSKMQWIARHALPGYRDAVWLEDLRADTFRGMNWRGALMRAALTQAGRKYDAAAGVARVSMKRDHLVTEAGERRRAARLVAEAVLADKSSRTEDKRAARATLRTLAAVDALPVPSQESSNAAQKDAATARAVLLVRDEQRAHLKAMAGRVERLHASAAETRPAWTTREHYIDDARNVRDRMREIARRYRLRMPSLPDLDALAAEIAPHAHAQRVAEMHRDARASLEHAESYSRNGYVSGLRGSARHYAEKVQGIARALRHGPDALPAWMVERAETLHRRAERGANIEGAAHAVSRIGSDLDNGDRHANGGNAQEAGRLYARAMREWEAARATLPPSHPARAQLYALREQRDAAAAYVANLAERIAAENAERVEAWRNGGPRFPGAFGMPPMLRISDDGRAVETSHGAIVPVSVAPRLWRLIESARGGDAAQVSAAYRGLRVGSFELREIRADGSAVVGCHDLPYTEMRATAARLGLVD